MIDAAENNASWCDRVCRAHGITGAFAADAWTSATRTPDFYPDAVTLVPDADVLDRIDASEGCSIKDSFAALELPGFEVLFEAHWLSAPPSDEPPVLRWERVPSMFDDERTAQMVGHRADEIGASASFHRTKTTAGVANVVGSYADLRSVATTLWPDVEKVVGYERDPARAIAAGFVITGPLRVWIRPPGPPAAAPR